jgi:hypothetical protein
MVFREGIDVIIRYLPILRRFFDMWHAAIANLLYS